MAVTRCLLLAGMAFAVVGSCFMLPLGGRHSTRTSLRARGGEEVDVKVGKTVQLTKEPPKQGVDLLGLVIGGVVGLVVAAGTALQGILNPKEAPKPWHPSQEPGNLQPVGFFDPLNFVKEDEKNFRKFRTAEIKHGRVAMMAAAGAVVQHYVRLPGLQDVPSGLAALQSTPGQIGAAVLFAACGVMELYVWKQDDKKEPGNFGDPAKWSQTGLGGGSYSVEMRDRELVNGRFAMLSIMGIFAAEYATGKDAIQQLTFKAGTAAPAVAATAAAAVDTAATAVTAVAETM